MEKEVLEFINRRFKNDCNWTTGNCYFFAAILQIRFPNSVIYYLPIEGHFVTKIEDNYYDWTGKIDLKELPQPLEQIFQEDKLLYNRLIRDCVK